MKTFKKILGWTILISIVSCFGFFVGKIIGMEKVIVIVAATFLSIFLPLLAVKLILD